MQQPARVRPLAAVLPTWSGTAQRCRHRQQRRRRRPPSCVPAAGAPRVVLAPESGSDVMIQRASCNGCAVAGESSIDVGGALRIFCGSDTCMFRRHLPVCT